MNDDMQGALPPGWVWTTLGEIAMKINPGFPSGQHTKEAIGVPHLRPMNVTSIGTVSLSETKYVEARDYDPLLKGDVLFNNTNSPELVGKTACIYQDTSWAFSNHMTRIRLLPNVCEPTWVSHYLHSLFLRGYFRLNCTNHVNQASISTGFLQSRVKIPLAPLNEQRLIVAKLEELLTRLDAGVAALKRAQANLKRYKASVLKAACEGKLVPTEAELARAEGRTYEPADVLLKRILSERRAKWEADLRVKGKDPSKVKYVEPQPPDASGLPELPEGWCWASLLALTSNVADVDHRMPRETDIGIPYVSTKDFVGDSEIDYENAKRISQQDYQQLCRKVCPEPGDILLSRYGTVGEVRSIKYQYPFQVSYSIAILKILPPVTGYLEQALRSESVQKQIKRDVRATAQPDLGLEHIRNFAVPFPPLREQHRIVGELDSRLSLIVATEMVINANLARAERLRQSILRRAFSGKLVTQDPSDEPASALLERIHSSQYTSDVTEQLSLPLIASKTQRRRSRRNLVL